jgi:hypothetical protein
LVFHSMERNPHPPRIAGLGVGKTDDVDKKEDS